MDDVQVQVAGRTQISREGSLRGNPGVPGKKPALPRPLLLTGWRVVCRVIGAMHCVKWVRFGFSNGPLNGQPL